ncbi:protein FAF-like, chloroplastic [Abrus precatorius]|uniref:Protein FAF-like, chloroplastic n=1 Tax=Abrus precatorius TaxID=3816 RepID=A0A8B8KWZ9_ABRPR|nr:protein FAF-like, chloroplastic [Abrus precatorius]
MSACGSLQHIFENPSLPENPTLLESLSWGQIKSIHHSSSFTEIFGELHFNESPKLFPSFSSSSFSKINHRNLTRNNQHISQTPSSSTPTTKHLESHKSSDNFSSLSSENLHLCTEGLGSESSDDVEDLKINGVNSGECWESHQREKEGGNEKHLAMEDCCCHGEWRTRSRVYGEYPPPISCIGKTGKPCVSFMSYRDNGRFVLKEIRIPTHEFLHAHREDGRLKLHFVQPDHHDDDDDADDDNIEDEEDYGDVENTDEGEENMGRENDENVTDSSQ